MAETESEILNPKYPGRRRLLALDGGGIWAELHARARGQAAGRRTGIIRRQLRLRGRLAPSSTASKLAFVMISGTTNTIGLQSNCIQKRCKSALDWRYRTPVLERRVDISAQIGGHF